MDSFVLNGKPLSALRVVDLRDELKKRGLPTKGTKIQLQELLITALQSETQQTQPPPMAAQVIDQPLEGVKSSQQHIVVEPEQQEEQEIAEEEDLNNTQDSSKVEPEVESSSNDSSNDSSSNDMPPAPTTDESPPEAYSSISVNEQNQAIKLTISLNKRQRESSSSESPTKQQQSTSEVVNDTSAPPPQPAVSSIENKEAESHHSSLNGDSSSEHETKPAKEVCERVVIEPEVVSETAPVEPTPVEITTTEAVTNEDKPTDVAPPKTTKNAPSREKLLSRSRSQNEEEANHEQSGVTPLKKRRWGGSSASDAASVLKKGISSDKLKELIKDTVEANENNAKNHKVSADDTPPKADHQEGGEDKVGDDLTVEPPKDAPATIAVEGKNEVVDGADIKEPKPAARKLSLEKVEEPKLAAPQQPPPPAKNPVSNVLFVTGLVRPYTMPQLKKLLTSEGGAIDESKFWIDRIKSKCYAVYESSEEAVKVREALHDLKWPQSSPKNLCIEFATLEDVERCLHPENYQNQTNSKSNEEKRNEPTASALKTSKYDAHGSEAKLSKTDKPSDSASSARKPVREWDKDKFESAKDHSNQVVIRNEHYREKDEADLKRARSKREHSPRTRDVRSHSRSTSPKRQRKDSTKAEEAMEDDENMEPKRSESPQKGLDELFRKTKTLPYVYWLPLSEQAAAARQRTREQAEREHQARLAANKPSPGRRSPHGYRNDRAPRTVGGDGGRRRSPSRSPVRRRSPPRNYSSRHSRSRSHSPADHRRRNYRDSSPPRRRR